ncbi:hypothetical protein DFH08DRAFT_1088647 [Mycena albidolilacea]|uniref:Uncharacterized protein n=1 Tax=Mycena albidolilacea TaxID=1033008 RepID=A0AAD7EAM6_9AGAR|nr:hypothetical protein DFH08DRAFT_1088647 [Mycena albidolilacea]
MPSRPSPSPLTTHAPTRTLALADRTLALVAHRPRSLPAALIPVPSRSLPAPSHPRSLPAPSRPSPSCSLPVPPPAPSRSLTLPSRSLPAPLHLILACYPPPRPAPFTTRAPAGTSRLLPAPLCLIYALFALGARCSLARSLPRCNSPTKPPRYSPPDTVRHPSCLQKIVYTLAVHREKLHLSALLVRYRCLRLRDLWILHLGQWSVVVPPPLRYCWRLTTVTPSHWQMRQRRIGATSSAGEWLLPRFTTGVLCGGQGRPPAFPAAGREGWMGTRPRYSVTLRLAQRCIGGRAAWALVWCRGAASRRADSGVVAKGRCGTARKAHVRWNCRGQYRMCRQQSRGVAVWSIIKALPGAAEYEEIYALHGAGRSVDERIA